MGIFSPIELLIILTSLAIIYGLILLIAVVVVWRFAVRHQTPRDVVGRHPVAARAVVCVLGLAIAASCTVVVMAFTRQLLAMPDPNLLVRALFAVPAGLSFVSALVGAAALSYGLFPGMWGRRSAAPA